MRFTAILAAHDAAAACIAGDRKMFYAPIFRCRQSQEKLQRDSDAAKVAGAIAVACPLDNSAALASIGDVLAGAEFSDHDHCFPCALRQIA